MATTRPSMPVPDFCFVLSALRGTVICLVFWGTLSPEAAVTEHPDDPGFAQGPLWVYHRLGAAGRVGVAGASEEGRTCPRTHCRPRNQVCGVLHALCCFAVCAWIEGSYRLMHACMSELLAPNIPFHRIYICFDCSGHPAVPCRVWHGKAGDITRCDVCPRVLGRLLGFGTAGGSLLRVANPDDIMNRYVHYYRTCLQ